MLVSLWKSVGKQQSHGYRLSAPTSSVAFDPTICMATAASRLRLTARRLLKHLQIEPQAGLDADGKTGRSVFGLPTRSRFIRPITNSISIFLYLGD